MLRPAADVAGEGEHLLPQSRRAVDEIAHPGPVKEHQAIPVTAWELKRAMAVDYELLKIVESARPQGRLIKPGRLSEGPAAGALALGAAVPDLITTDR